MRPLKFFLVSVLIYGFLFSCTKEESGTGNTAKVSAQPVGICGTWEWQSPALGEDEYLHIIFREHSYKVESHYMADYGEIHTQHYCLFYNHEQANYKIEDGKFYRWHVTPLPNFAEIPFQEGIGPEFNVTLDGDTLTLNALYGSYQGPDWFPTKYKLVRVR
ncbi:MAG: hypothetical protein IJP72_00145 [Bacteroidales bacterium]|nr:hypothetical protein [Bacteroidales bacterium]